MSLTVLLLLTLISAAQNRYENLEYGFKINFPDNWVIKNSSQKSTLIKAVNSSNNHISYISIAAYPVTKSEIEYFKNASPQEIIISLKEEYPNTKVELLDSGIKIIDGKRTLWTKVKLYMSETKYLITSNYHLIYNGMEYRITNATDGGEKLFDELKSSFEKSTYSIDFK